MKRIDLINLIDVELGLDKLVQAGIMNWQHGWYRDVYNQYDIYLKQGNTITQSVKLTAQKFDIEIRTVWNIKKRMERE